MVHKSEAANTKDAENPLAQANLHPIFLYIGSKLVFSHLSKIPFDHMTLVSSQTFSCQLSASFAHNRNTANEI